MCIRATLSDRFVSTRAHALRFPSAIIIRQFACCFGPEHIAAICVLFGRAHGDRRRGYKGARC